MGKKAQSGRKGNKGERFVISEVKGKRRNSWLLSGYSHDGERIRKKYKTYALAEGAKNEYLLKGMGANQRSFLTTLSEKQFRDAESAWHLLEDKLGPKADLLEAVNFYLRSYKHVSGLPLKDAVARYVDAKEARGRSERTLYEIKNRLGTFATQMNNRAVDEVLQEDVREFLGGFKGQNFNNYRTKVFSFFKWCVREGLCLSNPVEGIEREELGRDPEFFMPEEVKDLLRAARDTNDGELLPYLAIAFFAGLRPDSELKKLTWRRVNFEDSEIQVPKGKTGVARTVKASDNLMAFLHKCDRRKPIIPKGNFQRKFAAVKRAAGFKGGVRDSKRLREIEDEEGRKKWIPDGTRHSFITYHVREHGDIYKTATAAGNSPGVIKAHYEGAATSSEAKLFWAITPANLDEVPEVAEFKKEAS